jgi:hypothetical protein
MTLVMLVLPTPKSPDPEELATPKSTIWIGIS